MTFPIEDAIFALVDNQIRSDYKRPLPNGLKDVRFVSRHRIWAAISGEHQRKSNVIKDYLLSSESVVL